MDIHKRQVVAAGVDGHQKELFKPVKIKVKNFPTWVKDKLYPTDLVTLEATTNGCKIHDDLQGIVAEISIANNYKLKLISSSAAKTDQHDALVLAKLLAAN